MALTSNKKIRRNQPTRDLLLEVKKSLDKLTEAYASIAVDLKQRDEDVRTLRDVLNQMIGKVEAFTSMVRNLEDLQTKHSTALNELNKAVTRREQPLFTNYHNNQ